MTNGVQNLRGRGGVLIGALVLAVAGCGGGSSGSGTSASTSVPASTASPAPAAASTPAPGTPAASAPGAQSGQTWAYPAPSLVTAVVSTAATPGTAAPAPAPAPAPLPPTSTGPTLKGTLPVDPATGFSGLLFLMGQRLIPGSNVLVTYQGTPIKVLPGVFFSSEVIAINVFLTVPGDYQFTAVAPTGTTSNPLALTVPQGGALGAFTLQTPAIRSVFPPSLDAGFSGTVWIMGEHFAPGATLLVSQGGGIALPVPLVYVNERTVGWVTVAPTTKTTFGLQVLNPTLATSAVVQVAANGGPAPGANLAAPTLLLPPTSVASPFVGTTKVYGRDFLPGAVLELTDTATGAVTKTPLLFISSSEAWWTLFYPNPGSYVALLRNPDGQATPSWPFAVN